MAKKPWPIVTIETKITCPSCAEWKARLRACEAALERACEGADEARTILDARNSAWGAYGDYFGDYTKLEEKDG
jgi:hypothetical protein